MPVLTSTLLSSLLFSALCSCPASRRPNLHRIYSALYHASLSLRHSRWLDRDRASRGLNFHRVLEHVRLPLVSPYFLHDCVDKQEVVKENPKCRELLQEAVAFHLLPDRRHEMRNHRTRPRKSSGNKGGLRIGRDGEAQTEDTDWNICAVIEICQQ